MAELTMTPGTVLVLAILAAWAFLALRRVDRKGYCESGSCSGSCGCAAGCRSVDRMIADMDAAVAKAGR
ncbi:FeoB-associated Cys-rich membrane protein [Eggerthellaceae bacterium zg-1084]|uniref:FeoB-associated Cys-rich membrane protein n=1 Tax=Berryella wangjianweii TaxID=2734634 RepID=A0A6M8J2I9_9ACTN|nr:FeoB-associated Cys-rich membrane protein [Berryella wangjianweii]NPD30712.1 FeoB-associated Cys-rich membrane protein [Berryella wangjianweii]NPD32069.1 FeoB-associated Cys-rich membrane protein [Eggerthellaceae bacterium zg-997]QKF07351.1 FeoB-associated Cys-rich membrane protein [Berryella wangjianweii]